MSSTLLGSDIFYTHEKAKRKEKQNLNIWAYIAMGVNFHIVFAFLFTKLLWKLSLKEKHCSWIALSSLWAKSPIDKGDKTVFERVASFASVSISLKPRPIRTSWRLSMIRYREGLQNNINKWINDNNNNSYRKFKLDSDFNSVSLAPPVF